MLLNGWLVDTSETEVLYSQKLLPFPEYREILCGEGLDAICSGWFKKGTEQRFIDVRSLSEIWTGANLIVRGSR